MSAKFFLGITLLATLPLRAEVDASKSTMPEKFQSAPGLIKGGLFMEGSKKRFEAANELNLESYQTRLEVTPGALTLQHIKDPQPNDQIVLKFTLTNGSDKGSTLYFPTSQRCEAVIRDPAGKVIYTWSEDFEFAPDPGYSYINAGERLNYQITIPFQALRGKVSAGQASITASLVNYPQLKAEMPLEIQP
ncbi:MAG: hypothetical protein EBT57_03190 [Verrucomicrobia bacterium]|nr:hypothetical protein [Verrucomicrobiota bacterium]